MGMEMMDMLCRFLRIKADIIHYVLRPATSNGYEDVAAALWSRFKCRTLRHRDWALRTAVTMAGQRSTEGEVFAQASEYLDAWGERESIEVADATVRGNTAPRPWIPTTVGLMRQYAIGDREGPIEIRLVNRPLQERYSNGGYGESHVSYLVGSGDNLYEQEVNADGYCWIRSILMQYPQSQHGQKRWNPETGETLGAGKTSGSLTVRKFTSPRGADLLESLNREILAVVDRLAEYIANNPVQFQDAVDNINRVNTVEWEPLQEGHVQYEYIDARRLMAQAEDYIVVNFDEKRAWITQLNHRFRSVPLPVKMLVTAWVVDMAGAEELVRRYVSREWAFSHKLGMVTRRGHTTAVAFREYVREVLPDMASEQELPGE